MVLTTEWSQVEVIDLINDGNGLGFMLVGGRSTGVVIKALIPGGVAERDGRLQSGDHVLQIGDVNLRGFSSEQVATVLRQTGSQVRLVVARPVEPSVPEYQALASHAPIIPTKLLSDPDELSRQLYQNPSFATGAGFLNAQENEIQPLCSAHLELMGLPPIPSSVEIANVSQVLSPGSPLVPSIVTNFIELPETETYEVELRKNVYGLGITVAGYVCEEEDLSGIFVKSIIEGSAAEMSKKVQVNDRIVAVDGKSLAGVTNHQAVEILRNTGIIVNLTLERFLRGRKYEHLQVALTEIKSETQSQPSLPPSPSIATLSWAPPKSDADSADTEDGAECQIECELASHATFDSNMSMVLDNCENNHINDEDSTPNGSNDNGIPIGNGVHDSDPDAAEASEDGASINCDSENLASPDSSKPNTPTPTPSVNSTNALWRSEYPEREIIMTDINKLSGLGISLEGTVDVECGVEKRPHHFIRSILEDGPVGKDGKLKPGDELLQVNEHKLQGLTHTEVVKILKELPAQVKLVCARGPKPPSVINTSQDPEAFESRSLLPGGHECLKGLLTKAQSESSLYTSSTATLTDQQRSKSVEQVSGLALWSSEVIYIDIEKTERGFGFSILDYQDPLDPEGTVIVIRGLIPAGSAEATNAIFPGDRLISVAEHNLQGLTLDEAVSILKGMPLGLTKIGLCRPLSMSDNNIATPADSPSS